jgi:hypothetical protein
MSDIAEYIQISVDAVGGTDSDAGQEMLRLLLARENGEQSTEQLAEPVNPEVLPPAKEDSLFSPELESMFSDYVSRSDDKMQ